jgi:deazaflavin-dependent oxidoreductase (nitroreductase family)
MEPIDSPTGWVATHNRDYVESNGKKGHHWRGLDILLLTTTGRRSGNLRRTALIYGKDGDRYVIVASYGGKPEHPLWYLNLVADPQVTIQVGADVMTARAQTATAGERERLWKMMAAIFPTYEGYQGSTSREIPVVVLTPVASEGPAADPPHEQP